MSKKEAQDNLQNALVTTYMANLYFLSEIDKELYQRIEGLSQAINSGEYKENYSLDFLEKEGEFDIYDHKNDRYLYSKRPKMFNQMASDRVDFSSKGSFSILDKPLFTGVRNNIYFKEAEYFCNYAHANNLLQNDMTQYHDIFKNNISDYDTKKYQYVDKFIFIGTLLGRHILKIIEKTKAKTFFVCEKNLEIFRLSLFVLDYSVLARGENRVVFSIMDDEVNFNTKFYRFISYKSYENHTIKYFTTNFEVEHYFNLIMSSILANKATIFNYYMRLENIWNYITQRINKYPVLQLKQPMQDMELLKKPLLLLGAGPSLGENIEWIKENQNKFIILAIAATLNTLKAHNIVPDIVTTLDPQYLSLKKKQFTHEIIEFIKDSFILSSINTDDRFVKNFNKNKTFLYEVIQSLYSTNVCHAGYSVGEISASISLCLNFENIYFLGLDFALNQKTGETHSSGYNAWGRYEGSLEEKKQKSDFKSFSFEDELIEIKGNMQDKVLTNRLFKASADALDTNIIAFKEEEQNIYNLSNHGAYFEKTMPLKIENVQVVKNLDKKIVHLQLKEYLESISKIELPNNDFKKEYEYLENLQEILNDMQKNPSKSFDDFKIRVDELYELFLNSKVYCSYLENIFRNYFEMSLQYIYYCLNTQKLKKEKELLQKAEDEFLSKTQTLLTRYAGYLSRFL